MISKPATTQTEIHALLSDRWSGRAFDPSRAIDPSQIQALAEAARWSPSSMNAQPWRFTACLRGNEPLFSKMVDCLAPTNQVWARHAGLLLIVAAKPFFEDGKPNRWAQYDTGAAVMALSIEATSLGLMVHQMGGFNADSMRDLLSLPQDLQLMTVVAIGHQLDREGVPEALAEREFSPRNRQPIESIWTTKE